MKLIEFKIEHFRCLYQTDWIPFSELSIFTGENDGGKSTTLYALEIFLSPKRIPNTDDYSYITTEPGSLSRNLQETEIILTGKFNLNMSEFSFLQSVWGIPNQIIEVKRIFNFDNTSSPYLLQTEVFNHEAFLTPLSEHTVAELKDIATTFSIELGSSKLKQEIVNLIQEWHNKQPKVVKEVKLPDSLISSLPEIQIYSSESALDPENEIRRTLNTQFKTLLESEKYSGTISQIQRDIESDLNAGLTKLEPFIKQYSGDIQSVSIRPNFNFSSGLTTTELQLSRHDGRPILLKQSGAGQRRRFSLAIYEWSQEIFKDRDENSRQIIMAFDEPDTHLDYNAQREIFDVIRKFANLPAMQVVVCTHSLNFIERVPINQIVHYRIDQKVRHTTIEVLSLDDHETTELFMFEISKNMGLRNSVMLHERCFLIIEGPTEMSALPVLFHKIYEMPLQSAGICLINGENCYGARMLAKFLNAHKRKVLFLVDTDAITTDSVKKHFTPKSFEADGIDISTQVHYIGLKEFEDAFSDEVWARMAQKNFPKPTDLAWNKSDFTALRGSTKFSKDVQKLIQTEACLEYEPPKSDLGFKIAQCINQSEIPTVILQCFTDAYEYAN
ncbi:MAG: AAA family ATPase [Anaerolineaceae bacterium]|nr:AAA family ATPase [Anaerolineaceae bacterium]